MLTFHFCSLTLLRTSPTSIVVSWTASWCHNIRICLCTVQVWRFLDVTARRTVVLRHMEQAQYVKFVIQKTYPSESAGIWVDVHGCDIISTFEVHAFFQYQFSECEVWKRSRWENCSFCVWIQGSVHVFWIIQFPATTPATTTTTTTTQTTTSAPVTTTTTIATTTTETPPGPSRLQFVRSFSAQR